MSLVDDRQVDGEMQHSQPSCVREVRMVRHRYGTGAEATYTTAQSQARTGAGPLSSEPSRLSLFPSTSTLLFIYRIEIEPWLHPWT